jgi:rRNA maturation protein Rpf1
MPESEGKTPAQSAEKHPQIAESGFRALFAKLRKRRIIDSIGISFSVEPVGDAFSHRLSHLATVRKHKSRLGTCQ